MSERRVLRGVLAVDYSYGVSCDPTWAAYAYE